jgi:2-amino-4-hydroxy-6-hydroxymethyldihydropteridine diphosphokinase
MSTPKQHAIEAYIALGTNLLNREQNLQQALQLIELQSEVHDLVCSNIYETLPVGMTEQPMFLNMVIRIRTSLAPLALLHVMQQIESQLGRQRTVIWGPRTIDLDLLIYDQMKMHSDELILPHPRMDERAFVLIPFLDIVSQDRESLYTWASDRLARLTDIQHVHLWKKTAKA